ncbi:MAG TPA: ABC transporter ATP-binding protein [Burkholderiaceae bacterium]|nr:ABC transporter ATP-binding protein [Burkholderiaceae bacterium]
MERASLPAARWTDPASGASPAGAASASLGPGAGGAVVESPPRAARVVAPAPRRAEPPAGGAPSLEVRDLSVAFATDAGRLQVLDGLSFALAGGEIGCLLGSSGCGKTTALRAVAGFVTPDAGSIRIAGDEVSTPRAVRPPERRGVGVVFQDYALFPHLDVAGNVAFGLRRLGASERRERVARMLELVGLADARDRFPHELSGGQQQRVALARALAPAPALLLLDEPFSNLDPDLRESLALELRDILKRHGTTTLLVTHDQYEAFALADTVGVMERGRIAQWDEAYRLYHHPASRSVADFVGMGVFLRGRLLEDGDAPSIEVELGHLPIALAEDRDGARRHAGPRGELTVLLRPDDVVHDDASPIQATVLRKAFRGAQFLYTLQLPSGQPLLALVPSHHDHRIGEAIGIRYAADHIVTFPAA